MSERLVPYIEFEFRRRVMWATMALCLGAALLIRLLIEDELIAPAACLASPLVIVLAMHYWAHRHATEFLPAAERGHRYVSELSFGESVLYRSLFFGTLMALIKVDTLERLRDTRIVLMFAVGGLFFGVVTEWLTRWAVNRAARTAP